MTHSEILKLLNEVEEKFPVQDWRADKLHIWPLVRIKLAFLLYSQDNKAIANNNENIFKNIPPKGLIHQLSGKINWENRTIKHRLDDFLLRRKIKRKNTFAFFTIVASRTLLDKVWHNRSVDPIVDVLKHKHFPVSVFELQGGLPYRLPRYNKDVCISMEEIFRRNIVDKKNGVKNISIQDYDNFLLYIQNQIPQLNINTLSPEYLHKELALFNSVCDYFYILLKDSGIKICFTTCYYEIKMMALNAACKKLQIPTVELPHGTHGDTHAAYGKWQNVPSDGYEMLPDIFWCWSVNEKEAIDSWIVSQKCNHKTFLGGNPWMSQWLNEQHPLITMFDDRIDKLKINISNSKHLLFSTQPYNTFDETIPAYLIDAIEQSPAEWQWWIRLHPRQPHSIDFYQEQLKIKIGLNRINVTEATEFPLPALLRNMDVHLTLFSSAVIEAAEMGVPSVVIFENGHTIFKNSIPAEKLYYSGTNAQGIIDAVKILVHNRTKPNKADFFDYTAIERLIKTVNAGSKTIN